MSGRFRLLNLSPSRRVTIGRNIILTMGALYCVSRSVYYIKIGPEALSAAQLVITGNGHALGFWAALWAAAAALCIADMVNRHTRYGLSLLAAIATAWGICYLTIWAVTGFTDGGLVNSAVGWLAPAAFIFGFLLKVTALQDMVRARRGRDDLA